MAIMEAYCKKRCRHSTYQRRLFSRIKRYHLQVPCLKSMGQTHSQTNCRLHFPTYQWKSVPFSLSNNSHDTLQEEEDKTHEDSISAHSSDINKMSPYQDKGKRKSYSRSSNHSYIRNNCHHLFANKRQRTSSGIHTGTDSND